MEQQLHGRLTTLNRLKAARDDPTKDKFSRSRADKSIGVILKQLKDRKLMRLRERLIKATQAGDLHNVWKIENLMREHEKKEVERDE